MKAAHSSTSFLCLSYLRRWEDAYYHVVLKTCPLRRRASQRWGWHECTASLLVPFDTVKNNVSSTSASAPLLPNQRIKRQELSLDYTKWYNRQQQLKRLSDPVSRSHYGIGGHNKVTW